MIFCARSHIGNRRKRNEDCYHVPEDGRGRSLFVVADGMGGLSYGNAASRATVDAVVKAVEEESGLLPARLIFDAANAANVLVRRIATKAGQTTVMGSTLRLRSSRTRRSTSGTWGQPRLSPRRPGLTRITRDHTYVDELVRAGLIAPGEARAHPQRHAITRAIGIKEKVDIDVFEVQWQRGDTLLLCSDGLSNHVGDAQIELILKGRRPRRRGRRAGRNGAPKRGRRQHYGGAGAKPRRGGACMIGTLLMGRYRLTELVGSGGMANVYLARDEKEDREVAVKVLKDEHADNGVLVERFESEGRAGKLLHHRNIVRVYDTGEEGGRRFIVMEYARGVTLKEVIKQRISLDPEACIDIAVQVLRALAHAHAKGIVHRDVKPHNILLQANGDVKVYDFGIAQTIGEKRAGEEKTSVMGTVYYLSPEQARAEPAEVRSDIYSFGITLFEMLTGTVPFTGTSVIDVAKKHLNEEVPAPRSVDERIPKSLNDIVRKATRKNLRLRYRSAWEMRRDLMRARREPDGDFVRVKEERLPAGSEREKPQPDRARRRMYAIVGAVIVLVMVTVAVLVFGSVPPEQGSGWSPSSASSRAGRNRSWRTWGSFPTSSSSRIPRNPRARCSGKSPPRGRRLFRAASYAYS